MLPKEPYKKFAAVTLYVAVALAAIYIIFNYLWGAILPFLIAYIFAECFKPVVRYSEQHHRFPKRIFVLFVVFLAAGSLGALIFAISRQTVLEIRTLFLSVKEIITKLAQDDNYASELIKSISDSLPFGDITPKLWEFRENLDTNLWDMALSLGDKFSGTVLSLLGNAALFIPELILNTVVVIIATYYFAVDRVKVNCFFLSFFPRNGRLVLKYIKDILSNTVGQYIKAYGLLFFLTFGELLLSFSLLRLKYSFILAFVIAFVDLLPVLGTGTVLIPWGIICLVTQNYYLGVWLLIVYTVITVIRQIIEPKIVGKMFGLHPLAALAAMYVGLRLMGLLGIFIFGIGAIIISRVIDLRDEVRKENEKNAGI